MKIFDVTNVSAHKVEISKEVGALAFYSTNLEFSALNNEMINIYIDRNGVPNIPITPNAISLKTFILGSTYEADAISSFPATHYEPYLFSVMTELINGGNIEMAGNDRLIIELSGLDLTKRYLGDAITLEDTNPDDSDIYLWEKKVIQADLENVDLNIDNYDIMVLPDIGLGAFNPLIKEVNITHAISKNVSKYSMRELRMLSQDNDPFALVRQNGVVLASYPDFLQLDVSDYLNFNIIKATGTKLEILLRKNVRMVSLGLIK